MTPVSNNADRILARASRVAAVVTVLVVLALVTSVVQSLRQAAYPSVLRAPSARVLVSASVLNKNSTSATSVGGTLDSVGTSVPPDVLPPQSTSLSSSCLTPTWREKRGFSLMCIGDSITYGNGSHVNKKAKPDGSGNYPQTLLALLTAAMCPDVDLKVFNLGSNGATVGPTMHAYNKTVTYRTARGYAHRADVLVIVLGTNDTREGYWRSVEAFLDGYRHLIRSFLAANPSLKIVVCTPIPVAPSIGPYQPGVPVSTAAFHVHPALVRNVVRNLVRNVALEFSNDNVQFFDLYDAFSKAVPEYVAAASRIESGNSSIGDFKFIHRFSLDGLHPKAFLHDVMAQLLFQKLTALFLLS